MSDTKTEYPSSLEEIKSSKFFILDRKERTSLAVTVSNDECYIGSTFYKNNLGWTFNPTKLGKGYLTNAHDMDYTHNIEEAILNADQTL